MALLIAPLSAALFSAVLTRYVRDYALARKLLDIPNYRSSHKTPTPRGGGIAVVISVVAAHSAIVASGANNWKIAIAVGGSGLFVAAVGYIDDRVDVSAAGRLAVHTVAAIWLLYWIEWPASVPALAVGPISGVIALIFLVVGVVWMINLYNFMDGIDGLAAMEAVTVATGAAVLLMIGSSFELASIVGSIGAAAFGFLLWNWPPAKIFLGDVGSGFFGCVFGALALATHSSGALALWCWLILLGVFVVDATVTLFVRILRRESVHQAHRTHAYQHAARKFGGHRPVTVSVCAINCLWLLPLAALASLLPPWAPAFLCIGWLPLVGLALWLRAGRPE